MCVSRPTLCAPTAGDFVLILVILKRHGEFIYPPLYCT